MRHECAGTATETLDRPLIVPTYSDSARMYTSSNPFKKVCPITPISSSKDELLALTAELREANDYYPPPPVEGSAEAPVDLVESAGKKKVKAEKKDKNSKQHDGEVKIIRFIEEEHLPRVEKEIIVSPLCRAGRRFCCRIDRTCGSSGKRRHAKRRPRLPSSRLRPTTLRRGRRGRAKL